MDTICPLCRSDGATTKESILVEQLNDLYEINYGITNAVHSSNLEYKCCSNCSLGYFSPINSGDEELYERLQMFDWYYMPNKPEYKIALQYISDEESILEVGAGRGAFGVLAGKDRYTGLEFNNKALEKARAKGISLLKEPVEAHANRGVKYDVVVSFQVLEHVGSPATFIDSCVNCLKPGGKLIIAVPSSDGFCGKSINNILDMPPHHLTHWSEATLKNLAGLFDLSTLYIEHEPVAEYHKKWAKKTLMESAIRNKLGMQQQLIDRRISARIVSKLADLAVHILNVPLEGVYGHTVVAGYRKNT